MSRPVRSAITFLMGCLIFVLVPLLSWGPGDVSGFLGLTARFSFLILVLLLNALAAIRVPELGKERATAKITLRRQHLAVVLLQLFSIAVVTLGPYCDRRNIAVMEDEDATRFAGLFLYACGFTLMHLSEAHLGKQFTTEVSIHEGHQLVTDGPYRHIRHPRYLGIMIFSLGISLVFRSWLGVLCMAGIVATLLWRIHDEERLMHEEFQSEWEEYAGKTRRLVPGVF